MMTFLVLLWREPRKCSASSTRTMTGTSQRLSSSRWSRNRSRTCLGNHHILHHKPKFILLVSHFPQLLLDRVTILTDLYLNHRKILKVCLEDESLYHNLETKKPFSGSPRKDPVEAVDVPICPRFSLAAENRVTTKRRYSDICRKKKLLYNSDS